MIGLAIAAHRGLIAAPERPLAQVAHLLGGGLAGFMALAFWPAWPLLAAVVGMLGIQAARTGRIVDIGLLLSGFGVSWTLLGGLATLNDLIDPAVTSPGSALRFAVGVGVLLAGLTVAIARRDSNR
ncbi:MAG: hypothetical protein M3P32_02775 [Chloroflexota bacterium]|nr:hypothetical protein [Chloroflexota bacterium]